jgi:hypothetical protein
VSIETTDPNHKRRYFKVRPSYDKGPWLFIRELDQIPTDESGNSGPYEMEEVWLTDSEVNALPEFEGW